MRRIVPLLILLVLGSWCQADRLLLPVNHIPMQELCDALVRNPALVPQGVTRLWPLAEQNALIAEGLSEAIGQLAEIIVLFDRPRKQIAIEVGLVVTPATGPDKFNPDWFVLPKGSEAAGEGAKPGERRDSFRAMLRAYKDRGGKVILARSLSPALVANNTIKTVWLDRDFAGVWDPTALASGVAIEPRGNEDGTITLSLVLVAALSDPAQGARFLQQGQLQANLADGDSLLFGGHFLGEGEGLQEVTLVIIPRIAFGG